MLDHPLSSELTSGGNIQCLSPSHLGCQSVFLSRLKGTVRLRLAAIKAAQVSSGRRPQAKRSAEERGISATSD